MKKLSIICPVYNSEKYLKRCVASISNQTISDFEVILVDDGSTDKSGILCDQLKNSDSRIQVIHQNNQGQAAARNHALDIAQGEYIAFIDSDDYIHPEMFEILLKNAMENHAQISVGGYQTVTGLREFEKIQSEELRCNYWKGKDFLHHCLLDGVDKKPWVLWDKIFHRSCFEHIRMPEGRIHEDNAVVYKIIYEAESVVDCNVPLYYYFQNPDSTVNQPFKKKHLDWLLVPQEMITYFAEKQDGLLWDKANKMYLNELVQMYKKVKENLDNPVIEKKLKKQLMKQYKHEKTRYSMSIKTHPQVYETLYPLYSFMYWSAVGVIGKLRRK